MFSQETKAPARNADTVTLACLHPSMIIYHPSMPFHHASAIIRHPSSLIHRPSSIMAPFWGDYEFILGSFWDHFGIILRSCWCHFGITLGSCFDDFGVTLRSAFLAVRTRRRQNGRSPERPESRQNGPRQIGARSEARLEVPPDRPERQNRQNARTPDR